MYRHLIMHTLAARARTPAFPFFLPETAYSAHQINMKSALSISIWFISAFISHGHILKSLKDQPVLMNNGISQTPAKAPPRTRAFPHFVSSHDEPNADAASVIDLGEGSPSEFATAAKTNDTWISPPLPTYFYPIDDYLVIPNTRRYCEGDNILLATAAHNVRVISFFFPLD